MKKIISIFTIISMILLLVVGCATGKEEGHDNLGGNGTVSTNTSENDSDLNDQNNEDSTVDKPNNSENSDESEDLDEKNGSENMQPIDYDEIQPNESGKIMVVMFHNFISEYKSGDKEYTTTFSDFENLLQRLYDMDYRLISLNDMLNNHIDVPAGKIPMVFTFDDGSSGQFNLVEQDGKLVANSQSAVGIMEKFAEKHPDFGLKGTFFVNLGTSTFNGSGTMKERLKYLTDRGFELGNHTYTHINLKKAKDPLEIQKEIAENQRVVGELLPGYTFKTLSLPYGLPSKELQHFVIKGEYEGIAYENFGIMEVGWDPSVAPVNSDFNPHSIHRVRATGIEKVDADLDWWLENMSRKQQFISDGDPDTIAVPESRKDTVDSSKLAGKRLVIY